jgi:hypothetical protein
MKLKDPMMKAGVFGVCLYLAYWFLNSRGLVEGVDEKLPRQQQFKEVLATILQLTYDGFSSAEGALGNPSPGIKTAECYGKNGKCSSIHVTCMDNTTGVWDVKNPPSSLLDTFNDFKKHKCLTNPLCGRGILQKAQVTPRGITACCNNIDCVTTGAKFISK